MTTGGRRVSEKSQSRGDREGRVSRSPGDTSVFEDNDSLCEGILETTSQFICLLEHYGTIIRVNDAALAMGNLRREDVVGTKLWETPWFRTPEETRRQLREDAGRARDGEVVDGEGTVRKLRSGTVGRFSYSIRPVLDEDGNAVFLVVDGHERDESIEHVDRLERQNERFEESIHALRHDLRKHLNVANGYLELATENVEVAEIDDIGDSLDRIEQLDKVGNSLDRIDQLVEDVGTLLEEGQQVTDPELVKLAIVANEAWKHVESRGASLKIEDSMTILADKSRLMQLFENLFRNSVEHGSTSPDSHTRQDSVEHSSTSTRPGADDRNQRPDGSQVTIHVGTNDGGFYVEDDGPGIPEEHRGDVFTAGFTTSTEGSGFGLSIVERIVDAHGWTIDVTGGSEGGARFEIRTEATETSG